MLLRIVHCLIFYLCFEIAIAGGDFRCRVVRYEDKSDGSGNYVNNNVDREFDMLEIRMRYSKDNDLLLLFGLNGPNSLPSLRGKGYTLPSGDNEIDAFPGKLWWSEMYESVGPWCIRSLYPGTGLESINPHYTGGFHGCPNRITGLHTPSAQMVSYEYWADGRKLEVGDELICSEIECRSVIRIGSYNTYNPSTGSLDMALECHETYRFINDKILYDVIYEALEDVVLEEHYGLQTVSHTPYMGFFTDDGVIEYDTRVYYPSQVNAAGTPFGIYGMKKDGHTMFAMMLETDAFAGERNDNVKMFGRNYGANNFKQYHFVYGNGNKKTLLKGERDSYHGLFCFIVNPSDRLIPDYAGISVERFGLSDDSDSMLDVILCGGERYFYNKLYLEIKDTQKRYPLDEKAIYIPETSLREFKFRVPDIGPGCNSVRLGYMTKDDFNPISDYISVIGNASDTELESNVLNVTIPGCQPITIKANVAPEDVRIVDATGRLLPIEISEDKDGLYLMGTEPARGLMIIFSVDGSFEPVKVFKK